MLRQIAFHCIVVEACTCCGNMTPDVLWPLRRYVWFAFPYRRLDWWGALFYTVGVTAYIIAIASTIVNDCPNTLMTPMQYVRLRPLVGQCLIACAPEREHCTPPLVTVHDICKGCMLERPGAMESPEERAVLLQYGLIDIAYIIGGWLFGFAGLFYVMSDISMKVYPGTGLHLPRRGCMAAVC